MTQPYTYTGREYDPETGLYYYRARYYDPTIGRFLQTDPIGYEGGINLYGYVDSVGKPTVGVDLNLYIYAHNNPTNFTDPYGLWYVDINVSGGYWGGGTGGILVGPEGIYPYGGGGIMGPPGASGSITWSPQNPTPGWNVGLQGTAGIAAQGGYSFGEDGGGFWEVGIGWPPGVSLTGYCVGEPWKWPWRRDWWPWRKK